MLKIRLEGKDEEIYQCIDLIRKEDALEVLSISNLYSDRNALSQYKRCFIDVELENSETSREESI